MNSLTSGISPINDQIVLSFFIYLLNKYVLDYLRMVISIPQFSNAKPNKFYYAYLLSNFIRTEYRCKYQFEITDK